MSHDLLWWAFFVGRLAVETALVAALAGAAASRIRSPRRQRAVWQTALLAITVLAVAELTDLRPLGWFRTFPTSAPRYQAQVTVQNLSASSRPPVATDSVSSPASPPPKAATNSRASTATAAPTPTPVSWPGVAWLVGSSMLLLRLGLSRLRLAQFARRQRPLRPPTQAAPKETQVDPTTADLLSITRRLQSDFGLKTVRILGCPTLRGPVAFGILRPTIVVPGDLAQRFSVAQQEAMLAHELAHLAGRDPLWRWVADLVVALLWWHPAAWWTRRRLQVTSETAADEATALVPGGRIALAESLVLLGREMVSLPPLQGLGVVGDGLRSQLARRVTQLLASSETWRPEPARWRWAIRGLAAVGVGATLAAPWPGQSPVGLWSVMRGRRAPHQSSVDASPKPEAQPFSPPTHSSLVADPQYRSVVAALGAADQRADNASEPGRGTPQPSSPSIADTDRPISLEVQFVNIQERSSDDLGLDWLFGQSPTNNPAVETGSATNLPAQQTTPQGKGLRVEFLRMEGQSVTLWPEQFAALKHRLKSRGGLELIASPRVTTLSGRQAQVQIQEDRTLVTGVSTNGGSATSSPAINYLAERVQFGPAVDVLPVLEGDIVRLKILASVTEFLGYDDPKNQPPLVVQAPGAAPLTGVLPLPHVRFLRTGADGTRSTSPGDGAAAPPPDPFTQAIAKSGETVLLRGPLVTEVQRQVDKVVFLGDLPLIGGFFRQESTNTVRKRLYIFVTVTVEPKE